MDIGVVLQCNPPASRVIDLARQAETHGFSHVWTFDSHLLWQEPYVIYSQILASTRKVVVGPMVTNPSTRDVTVTASTFATLNEMYGNRTVCGIGRGDSAVRTLGGKPTTIARLEESIEVIRELGNGRSAQIGETTVRFPWAAKSELEVWVAGYGPRALELTGRVADGFILQLADPDITAWTIATVRAGAEAAGRDPDEITMCVAAPAYITDGSPEALDHARNQCRWFGGMVGNHVADIVTKYGADADTSGRSAGSTPAVPKALTDYIAGREGYDYNQHGRAGNTHADFVPDEIVDRFCLLGPPSEHVRRLKELEKLGVDQFAVYLQHDNKTATLDAYGESVLPELIAPVTATQ